MIAFETRHCVHPFVTCPKRIAWQCTPLVHAASLVIIALDVVPYSHLYTASTQEEALGTSGTWP
jgi:hypothetical protein